MTISSNAAMDIIATMIMILFVLMVIAGLIAMGMIIAEIRRIRRERD